MHPLPRRKFLQGALFSAAALSLPARLRAAAEGANSDIRMAVIGFNGRGQDHIANYLKLPGVRIVALCDVDPKVLEKGAAQLRAKGQEVQTFVDIRKLLESKEIDAVSIATPNHWHALGAIWACQAGKDVYVEKPVSHNVWEGRQLVRAAAAHQRIVQMGVQSRSGAGIAGALEWAKAGNLGKLKSVHGLCYKHRPSIEQAGGVQPLPEGLDYDLWCGPAKKSELRRKRLHYDWHWVWETGNGDLGNQGIHQMDIARRFLGEAALAPKVFAVGGRLGYEDDGETPNSLVVCHDYQAAPLIFEVRGLPSASNTKEMDRFLGTSIGVIAQYENGHILVPNYNDAAAFDSAGKLVATFGKIVLPKETPEITGGAKVIEVADPETQNHYANFLKGMRSRKESDLNGKILDGHISSALCHTANISYRLGKKSSPEVIREKLQSNQEAGESYGRLLSHLEANGVAPRTELITLGEFLPFDPVQERFISNPAADQLLTRDYRAPFLVPEKV